MSGEQRWALVGEAVVAIARRPRGRRAPSLHRRLPLAPCLVVAARWQSSPVGRFDEVAVLEPALAGVRPGFALVAHGVSVPQASGTYRSEWSLPADPATIRWSSDSNGCTVTWEEEALRAEARTSRWLVPLMLPIPLLQGGRVPFRVPQRLRGLARPAAVTIACGDPSGELAWLAGSHRGLVFRAARLAMLPRRASPAAALQSLRLLPAKPEPAAQSFDGERLQSPAVGSARARAGSRALSSVG